MLFHRLRRWSNIKQVVGQTTDSCIVIYIASILVSHCLQVHILKNYIYMLCARYNYMDTVLNSPEPNISLDR